MVSNTRLTVCIPVYNMQATIGAAIDSAVLSVGNYSADILVIDNASNDETYTIIKNYESIYPCVRVIRNDTNVGFANNFIKCIAESNGEFVTFIGADDLLLPGITSFVDEVSKHESVVVADASIRVAIDSLHSGYRDISFGVELKKFTFINHETVSDWWLSSAFSALPGWIVRRSSALYILSKMPTNTIIPQIHLAFYLSQEGDALHIPLAIARQHLGNSYNQLANKLYMTNSTHREMIMLISQITPCVRQKILNRYLKDSVYAFPGYKAFSGNKLLLLIFKSTFMIIPKSNMIPLFRLFTITVLLFLVPKKITYYGLICYRKLLMRG